MITASELREKYFKFFESKGHTRIPSASLVPENDPTVLFTTAGMHPLVPYLLGEKHPGGKRVVSVQKCVRTGDIDSVGDSTHLTFFEMLGNWSFGDYFKKEAIEWSWEFLTDKKWLGIEPKKLFVTVYQGDDSVPRDEESIKLWQTQFKKSGLEARVGERIFALGREDNWWGPAGKVGPCGPDTEMFFDTGKEKCSSLCQPGCSCGKFVEIWNDVFMEYNKRSDEVYVPLAQKNVDTGMGVERTVAVLNGLESVFEVDTLEPIMNQMQGEETSRRIISDHIRAGVMIIADGVEPSHIGQGYILRRLIRRALRHLNRLGIAEEKIETLAQAVIGIYRDSCPKLKSSENKILNVLHEEESRFQKTLASGLRYVHGMTDLSKIPGNIISGADAFILFSTYGFPIEMTEEIAKERGMTVDIEGFKREMEKHQELSRTASAGMFKGGLADDSEIVTKYHTATHLLHAALRQILGKHVEQRGSNITAERLRFDFSHQQKMTTEEIKKVEDWVNDAIQKDYSVSCEEMTVEEAKKLGTIGLFESKYGERVKVYSIGDISKEICGGPHTEHTGVLGKFKIQKEEASSAGVRRIKAVLE